MRLFVLAIALLVIAVPSNGQVSLALTGNICAGDSVTASVSGGGPMLLTMLAMGETTGSTTIGSGASAVTIGLDNPFVIIPIGFTDANGDVDLTINIPAGVDPSILPGQLHVQAATLDFSVGMGGFSLTIETSGVQTVTGGTSCP